MGKSKKFNPENKETLTFAEALGPAMSITTQEDADQYLRDYIDFQQKWLDAHPKERDGLRIMTAEQICKENIGYYAGYYDEEVVQRVRKLFKTNQPFTYFTEAIKRKEK